MKNKYTQVILLVFLLFTVSGCGQTWWETLFERKNVLVITGRHTISGETLELKPGTIVRFKPVTAFSLAGTVVVESGELVFENGGRLIARGTPGNPIIFTREEDEGILTFKENCDGTNSIIEYCEFKEEVHIKTETSLQIKYCKFKTSWPSPIQFYQREGQVNGFVSVTNNTFRTEQVGPRSDVIIGQANTIEIAYNDIDGGYIGVSLGGGAINVHHNNIVNCTEYAISAPSLSVVDNNYIANNAGKTGIDTTGEQSKGVSYINPRTSPVLEAGCSW